MLNTSMLKSYARNTLEQLAEQHMDIFLNCLKSTPYIYSNPSFNLSFFLAHDVPIDYYWISGNPTINIEFVDHIASIQQIGYEILVEPSLYNIFDSLIPHTNRLNWSELSKNPAISAEYIFQHLNDRPWNFPKLGSNMNLTRELAELIYSQLGTTSKRDLFVLAVGNNLAIGQELRDVHPDWDWDWNRADLARGSCPRNTYQCRMDVQPFLYPEELFHLKSQNPEQFEAFLRDPNGDFNYKELSANDSVTPQVVMNYPDKPWDWCYIFKSKVGRPLLSLQSLIKCQHPELYGEIARKRHFY